MVNPITWFSRKPTPSPAAQIAALRQQVKSLDDENKSLAKNNETLEGQVAGLQRKLKAAIDDNTSLIGHSEAIQSELNGSRGANDVLRNKIKELQNRIADMDRRHKEELDEVLAANARMADSLSASRKLFGRLREATTSLVECAASVRDLLIDIEDQQRNKDDRQEAG